MNKMQQQFKKAKKKGLSPIEVLHMKEIAKKEAKKMEDEAAEKAFIYTLAVPLLVLSTDYWQKTAKKRAPKFIKDVASLYDSLLCGVVTEQELADDLFDLSGIRIEAEWMKAKEEVQKEKEGGDSLGRC